MKKNPTDFGCIIPALVAAVSLAGSGCSYIEAVDHYSLSSQELQRYKTLQILTEEQRAQGDYRSVGEIRGISCSKIHSEPPNERDAIDQVRLRASQVGAHAISPPVCVHSTETDWKNNCWSSVICSAEVLVDQTREQPPAATSDAPPTSD
ncbi:MAG: hypothetical protein OEM03_10490 [Chromatiales bacterium]|nr:hypothetical protein [Chromatiales bacterium]